MPSESAIVAIFEGEQIIVPKDETVIRPGHKILILTKRESSEDVKKFLS